MKLDEGVLAIAGGVALGLLVLKVVGKIFGVGLKGLILLYVEGNHRACLMIIEKNKVEIKDKLLANLEITDAIQNGELTKKLVKNLIERELRDSRMHTINGVKEISDLVDGMVVHMDWKEHWIIYLR